MQITKADNGGFVVNETPDTFLAAVSTVKELCVFIEGYYGTSAPVVGSWIERTGESVPPFTDDTELVVIWKDGVVTHPQPWQSFSEHWKSVAYYRLVKGGSKAPMSDGWIEWSGGDELPSLNEGTRVAIRRRDGGIYELRFHKSFCANRWLHSNVPSDIVAYRVL